MAMNYENMGTEIKAEYDALAGEDIYTASKVIEAQAKAIVTHIQTNAEINSTLSKGTLSTQQTISSDQETVVNFSGDNIVSGVFTAPTTGYYLPDIRLTFADDVSTSTLVYAYIKKNTSEKIDYLEVQPYNKATMKLSCPIYLESGDTLTTIIYQIDGINSHILDNPSWLSYMSVIQSGQTIS